MFRKKKGIVLVVVVTVAVIFAIVGFVTLSIASQEINLTRTEIDRNKAFYYAEAGLAKLSEAFQRPITGNLSQVLAESIGQGSFSITLDTNQIPYYAVSTGTSGTITKKVRVEANFLAVPLEKALFAMNTSGSNWAFQLRGTGNPTQKSGYGTQWGGKDIINGNLSVDGDVYMYDQSSIEPAPAPNKWGYNGDVGATGSINVLDSAHISGATNPHADEPTAVDLISMDYAHNNTYDVAKTFNNAGVTSGYLPVGNPLRDVFNKNPNRTECGSTPGVDDYFFEPASGFTLGTPFTGDTPLHAGNNRVYYVDGDVWISGAPTYGFKMDGKVTIVATGDIHICDNLEYKNPNKDMLGLVALGKYNPTGKLIKGGNIYFGDAVYGNMYTASAMMFAANNFLFNTDRTTNKSAEPDTGFVINGNFAAMNQVSIDRDWYDKTTTTTTTDHWGHTTTTTTKEARVAKYDSTAGQWIDAETGTALTSTEIDSHRHYQMIVNYDSRVRDQTTQPPGLPRGGTKIFAGFSNWQEL
jgi:roadblock/LC7 domain-containing protein